MKDQKEDWTTPSFTFTPDFETHTITRLKHNWTYINKTRNVRTT